MEAAPPIRQGRTVHARVWPRGPTLCGKPVADARRDGDAFTRDVRELTCSDCARHPSAREAIRNVPSSYQCE